MEMKTNYTTPSFNDLNTKGLKIKNMRFLKLNIVSRNIYGDMTKYFVGDDETFRFIIPEKIKEMLLNSKVPRNPELFKLPFDSIFLDTSFENDKIHIPYGFYLTVNNDDEYTRQFFLCFAYYYKGFEDNPLNFIELNWYNSIEPLKNETNLRQIHDEETRSLYEKIGNEEVFHTLLGRFDKKEKEKIIKNINKNFKNKKERDKHIEELNFPPFSRGDWYSLDENPTHNYKYWNQLNQKQILSFICNYLLFLNDPRIKFIKHEGRKKNFKKKVYDFNFPKTMTVLIENTLQRYINNFNDERTKVKFNYHYKFLVRGHFRKLKSKKYKEKKRIWILPYYKGRGLFVKKDYELK